MSGDKPTQTTSDKVAGAIISDDKKYRYELWRKWSAGPTCLFIMLNPSTADGIKDDPTIRKCFGFAKRLGCGTLFVGNLFAVRATKPENMLKASDPVGPSNKDHLYRMADAAKANWPYDGKGSFAIAAWGTHGSFMQQDQTVRGWFDEWGIPLKVLDFTKNGYPKHPLYVPYSTELKDWS